MKAIKKFLVLFPGESYEHEIEGESIRHVKRLLKEKLNVKSLPKGTQIRYADLMDIVNNRY